MIKYEISSQVVELAPGQTTQVNLTLSNQSNIIDYFELGVEPVISPEMVALNPAWVSLTPATFSLRPALAVRTGRSTTESEQAVQLTITIPAQVAAGSYAGRIVLKARSGEENNLVVPFNVVVPELEAENFQMIPTEITSRRSTAIYRINVQNMGNSPKPYSVYAEDRNDNCKFSITPSEVFLQPMEETAFTLRVRPHRRNWASTPKNYSFSSYLEGLGKEISGEFTQKCALPPLLWLKTHLVGFLVFFGIVIALLIAAFVFFLLPELSAVVRDPACAPFSERTVRVVSNNQETQIFISSRLDKDPLPVPALTERATSLPGLFAPLVSVSADGRRLAYVTARNQALDDAKINLIDLETNQRFQIPVEKGLFPTAPIWSANGERLIFFKRPATVAGAATTTAPPAATTAGTPGAATSPAATNPPTAIPQGTPGSFRTATQLELWVMDKFGPAAKAVGDKEAMSKMSALDSRLFYGTPDPEWQTVCWTKDNNSVVVRGLKPAPTDKLENITVSVIDLDGKVIPTKLGVPTDAIQRMLRKIPGIGSVGYAPAPALFSSGSLSLMSAQVQTYASASNPATDYQTLSYPVASGAGGVKAGLNLQTQVNNPCALDREKIFSQNDPRWADLLLGSSNARMADLGCPIAAAAMMLNLYGVNTDPAEVLTCLGPEASPLNPIGWNSAAARCSNGKLLGATRTEFSWTDLNTALGRGPVVVGLVGSQVGSTFQHFVVVYGGVNTVGSTYQVYDPWDGSSYKNLALLAGWGYRPNLLISFQGGDQIICNNASANPTPGTGGVNPGSGAALIEINGVEDGGVYSLPQVAFNFSVNGGITTTAEARLIKGGNNAGERLQTPIINTDTIYRAEGVYNVNISANSASAVPVERDVFFTIDRTGPEVISHTLTPPVVPGKPADKPVSVSLRATDALSGIARIEFQRSLNGPWELYTSDTTNNSLIFNATGNYRIAYRAWDGAGNVSRENLIEFDLKVVATTPGAGGTGGTGTTGGGTPGAIPTPTPIPPLKPGGNLTIPTITPVPTATPRPVAPRTTPPVINPALPGGATTTAAVTTVIPTFTPALTVVATTTAAVTTVPASTTAATTTAPATTAVVTTTPTVTTTTAATAPKLDTVPGSITVPSDNTPQNLSLKNIGAGNLTFTVEGTTNGSLLQFAPANGTVLPGGESIIIVSALTPNQTGANQTAVLRVTTNDGVRNVNVILQSPQLPTAAFEPISSPSDLVITTTLKLAIDSTGALTPAFAIITGTYITTEGGNPVDVNLTANLTAVDNWTYNWNTSAIIPQSGIKVRGKLCVSPTICSDIPEVNGLVIRLFGVVNSPTDNSILSATQPVSMTVLGRVSRVALEVEYQGTTVPLTVQPTLANNWLGQLDTLTIPPDVPSAPNPITLKGQVCASLGGFSEFCQPISRFITNLRTVMTGTVGFNPLNF